MISLKCLYKELDIVRVIKVAPQGSRGRGRPKVAWRKTVLEEAKIIGKSWNEIKHTARSSQMEKPHRGPMFRDRIMGLCNKSSQDKIARTFSQNGGKLTLQKDNFPAA
jgi:hypothetical protein